MHLGQESVRSSSRGSAGLWYEVPWCVLTQACLLLSSCLRRCARACHWEAQPEHSRHAYSRATSWRRISRPQVYANTRGCCLRAQEQRAQRLHENVPPSKKPPATPAQYHNVCLVDVLPAHGFKVEYVANGPFWAMQDGSKLLVPWQCLDSAVLKA